MKIGVMGARGSFSEEAGRLYATKYLKRKFFTIEYLITPERTLAALENDEIDLAILAIENSTMGVVMVTVEAMAVHRFKIKHVFPLDVRHNLLVRPGTHKKHVKTIVSQDPAIQQCKKYLERKWSNTKIRLYPDTAKAAADLASGKLAGDCAVIASRAAAEVYGLDILESGIQDLKHNATSFIAAKRLK
jgi:prephenate dehydratase